MTHILSGKRAICQFVGRGWATVEKWILTLGFPAKIIAGIWESDSELITAWRRGLVNGQPKSPKLVKNRGKKILKTKYIEVDTRKANPPENSESGNPHE